MKPRLLDTFCGAGGTSYGYHQAGFEVVGVDHKPQPRYPFEFHQADALEFIAEYGQDFDVIGASPPCQFYSITASLSNGNHPDLIPSTRKALISIGKPYIIENVPGAPLINPLMLCGTMFGLRVIRHRLFEIWPEPIWFPPFACNHYLKVVRHGRPPDRERQFHGVTGHFSDIPWAREIMGCHWMTGAELSQAIPPAYTRWLGERLLEMIGAASSAPHISEHSGGGVCP